MDISSSKFFKLRSLLFLNINFQGVSDVVDLDDFAQECLTEIESYKIRRNGIYRINDITNVIKSAYVGSKLESTDGSGNIDELASIVADEFTSIFQ